MTHIPLKQSAATLSSIHQKMRGIPGFYKCKYPWQCMFHFLKSHKNVQKNIHRLHVHIIHVLHFEFEFHKIRVFPLNIDISNTIC